MTHPVSLILLCQTKNRLSEEREFVVLLFGTTVVVIRTPEQIVIAADSLSASSGLIRVRESVCKIVPIGNTWFTFSGLSHNTRRTFDVQQIAKRHCSHNSPLKNIQAFAKVIIKPLIGELTRLRQADRTTYNRKVNNRERVVLQALFAGLEGRELTTAWANFIAIHRDPAPITLKPEFSICPPQCDKSRAATFLGKTDKIAEFLKRTRDFSRVSDSNLAEQMVNLEVDGVEVDGPIDVLAITKRGYSWVKHKQECQ